VLCVLFQLGFDIIFVGTEVLYFCVTCVSFHACVFLWVVSVQLLHGMVDKCGYVLK